MSVDDWVEMQTSSGWMSLSSSNAGINWFRLCNRSQLVTTIP